MKFLHLLIWITNWILGSRENLAIKKEILKTELCHPHLHSWNMPHISPLSHPDLLTTEVLKQKQSLELYQKANKACYLIGGFLVKLLAFSGLPFLVYWGYSKQHKLLDPSVVSQYYWQKMVQKNSKVDKCNLTKKAFVRWFESSLTMGFV